MFSFDDFIKNFYDGAPAMTNNSLVFTVDYYGTHKFFVDLAHFLGEKDKIKFGEIAYAYHYAKKWFNDHS
jgi:hypothetical protein